jgi:outer membrane protein TolC
MQPRPSVLGFFIPSHWKVEVVVMRAFRDAMNGAFLLAGLIFLCGCVLAPQGTQEEQAKLYASGRGYELPAEKRTLADLPQPASWQDVLHRAFLANGDLESAYFEWQAAVAQIDQAAAWPNSNVQVGYEYMFSSQKMKAWNRTTLSAGFDPSVNLQLPIKAQQAGKVALEEARAAGYRFAAAKFDLQKKVLTSYLDLALMEEKIHIQRDNVSLLKILTETANSRVQAGGPQQDLYKAQIAWRLAGNDLASMELQHHGMLAMLNGMLGREAQAPLSLPTTLPAPRQVTTNDARLIEAAVDLNPELAGLAREVAGREDALELARLRYIPDINPTVGVTGNIAQSVGAMVMLPTNIAMIRGAVNQSAAMLRSSEAMSRQVRSDRAASFVASLYAMRNAERQIKLFQQEILPAAEQVIESSRQAYSTGSVGFADLIDSQRTLLEVRQMIAEARIERERRLAELEALAGVDIETLAEPATRRASTQASDRQPTPSSTVNQEDH